MSGLADELRGLRGRIPSDMMARAEQGLARHKQDLLQDHVPWTVRHLREGLDPVLATSLVATSLLATFHGRVLPPAARTGDQRDRELQLMAEFAAVAVVHVAQRQIKDEDQAAPT